MIDSIRRALGRTKSAPTSPPPAIDEPITRLVHMAIGLPELFARRARENGIQVESLRVAMLHERLIAFLRTQNCRTLAVSASPFLDKLRIAPSLESSGFDVARANAGSTPRTGDLVGRNADPTTELAAAITDVYCTISEIGGLVIHSSPAHSQSNAFACPIHIAILEPRNFLPDLVDLFEKLPADGSPSISILTAPVPGRILQLFILE